VQVCYHSKQKKPRDELAELSWGVAGRLHEARRMTYGVALDFGSGLGSNDADEFAAFVALYLKYDFAVGSREQGVVLAEAYVVAGMEMRAALTHDNVAGFDGFAAEALDA
jgi:hypothetical protein